MRGAKNILLLTLLLPFAAAGQGFKTTLKGTVTRRDDSFAAVKFAEDDLRTMPRYTFPIENGRFEFTIEGDTMRMFTLVLEHELQGGLFNKFFPDAEVVEFTLYDQANDHKNEIRGGELNRREKQLFESQIAEFMPEYAPVNARLRELSAAGEMESDEAKELTARMEDIDRRIEEWTYREYTENPDDIVLYSLFTNDVKFVGSLPDDMQMVCRAAEGFAAAHPGHPYNAFVETILNAIQTIKAGGRFADFTAPDMDGTMHTLSEEIEGKVALIDLWASWCGWCIVDSRKVIPIYNEWKERGFTVVGVAREMGDTDALATALAREKFPWLNLVELDDRAKIWNKYGIPNMGGSTFLVDRRGTIVRISPTADEIREYLEKNL